VSEYIEWMNRIQKKKAVLFKDPAFNIQDFIQRIEKLEKVL
jgi:hypothetical protein